MRWLLAPCPALCPAHPVMPRVGTRCAPLATTAGLGLVALGLQVLGLVALVALGAVPRSRSSCRWAPVQDLSRAVPAARGRAVMGGSEAGRQLLLPGLGI